MQDVQRMYLSEKAFIGTIIAVSRHFGMAKSNSGCIWETDNRLQLVSDENRAYTKKNEQCYIFGLLMQLEKRYSLGIKCSNEIKV